MKRVLVLDANQRAALAITRSLGKHGFHVVTADTVPETLSGASRHSSIAVTYPSPHTAPSEFLSRVCEIVLQHNIDIALPVTDVTTFLLAKNSTTIPCALPCPSFESYELLSNKYRLFQFAIKLGLPVPHTIFLEKGSQAAEHGNDLTFPLVVKPFRSKILENGSFISTSVIVVNDRDELLRHLAHTPYLQQYPLMLQEYIIGDGQGLFGLYHNGVPVTFFSHKRIREKPPSGGVSVLSESVAPAPRMLDAAKKLLDAAQWHGVAMVEFKVAADGTPYLMEVNGRFWGSLQLAIDAGVDFPYLACQLTSAQSVSAPSSYRIGVRSRWLLGDLDRLYLVLKGGQSAMGKLWATLQFLNFLAPSTRSEINRLSDPMPFFFELKHYLRELLNRSAKNQI
jgi:predicted ATP-grasp superfamily ATP-dependent carboligase